MHKPIFGNNQDILQAFVIWHPLPRPHTLGPIPSPSPLIRQFDKRLLMPGMLCALITTMQQGLPDQ